MSLTARVLTGLALGLAVGAVTHAIGHPVLNSIAAVAEPLGKMWVNAILMTVIPLVVSILIVGVASTSHVGLIGRLGLNSILLFLLLATASAGFTALVAPRLLSRLPLDPATTASLRAGAAAAGMEHAKDAPTMTQWLVGLVPSNPFKAAADGAMLPLVMFTLAFALATTRLAPGMRAAIVGLAQAVAGAMRVLIDWVLAWAPFGVFALALPLAARLGGIAAIELGYYVVVVSATSVVLLLMMYPLALAAGKVPLRDFARAAAPAQAVAFSARSSLASLPALIDGAERHLDLPPSVTGFCLPLAVSMFKFCAPVVTVAGMLFIGHLYGVTVDPARLLQASAIAVLLSLAAPGVPGGGLIVATPMFVSAGLPVEGVGILLAVDTIPDMFRAPANATADLAVATIISRHLRGAAVPLPATSAPLPAPES